MTLSNFSDSLPEGWLAFELSILRRLQFRSVADPLAGEADTCAYLKRWGVRVAANDPAQWAWQRALSRVENNTERLEEADGRAVLEDAYVPRHRLYNAALRRWFGETDAWSFDNVRANIENHDTPDLEARGRARRRQRPGAVGLAARAFACGEQHRASRRGGRAGRARRRIRAAPPPLQRGAPPLVRRDRRLVVRQRAREHREPRHAREALARTRPRHDRRRLRALLRR